jgi:Fe-S cluster assembly ATP-binding protein
MIQIDHLSVSVNTKSIIYNLSYTFEDGIITAILGHNGSGKSSLAFALAGHPRYQTTGALVLDGYDIVNASPTERHEKGIFLSFQNIPEIPGVKCGEYLRTVYNAHFSRMHPEDKLPSAFVFRRMIEKFLPDLGLTADFLDRDLFVGFSWGEKRRIELLQIALLDPQYIFLDEIDAGLDIDALSILSSRIDIWRKSGKTVVIITHNFHLLDAVSVDNIVIMKDGDIVEKWWRELVEQVRKNGFK